MMDFDFTELAQLIGGLAVAIVMLGAFISRYTKTPKDDEFFARLKKTFGLGGDSRE